MQIKDRVKEFKRIKASDLKANPKNWRLHDAMQKEAMQSVLQNVGMAGAVIVYENKNNEYVIIDGHLRADMNDDHTILSDLLKNIETNDDELQTLLNDIDETFGLVESELPEQDTDAFYVDNPINERNKEDLENPEELEDKLKEKTKEGLAIMIVYVEQSKEQEFKANINKMGKAWGLDNHSDIIVKSLKYSSDLYK